MIRGLHPPMVDRDRLTRIRNYQSTDWYPAIVMRPITILVMLVIADWKWVTPNRLTHVGNLCKVACAGCLLVGDYSYLVAAVILLQLGLLFDHLDGTMARYRRTWSGFGSYLDKVSDLMTWFPIIMAVGWLEYTRSGEALMLVLAAVHCYAMAVLGYMKWVAEAEIGRLDWHRVKSGNDEPVARRTAPPKLSVPPQRSASDWLKWFFRSMVQIVRIEEMDLFFWVGLFLLIGHLNWLLWVLAATQVVGVLIMAVKRGLDVAGADSELKALRETSS
jgi:phosphatidylglycerophosphate synthase